MTAISGATVGAGSAACSACSGKMLKLLFTLVVLTSLLTPQPVISIQVLPDGGYSGIVIKISQDVPQENCADILQKIQVSYNIYTRNPGYSSYTKGQIISKGLLVSRILPINERRNSFLQIGQIRTFVFLGEFEETKKSFQNYPTFRMAAGYSYTKCLSFILSFYVAGLDMVRIL